jgi:hypothetical protein
VNSGGLSLFAGIVRLIVPRLKDRRQCAPDTELRASIRIAEFRRPSSRSS